MSALGVAASPGFDEHFNDLEQAQIDPYSPDFIERVNRRRKLKMRAASQQVGPAGSAAAPRTAARFGQLSTCHNDARGRIGTEAVGDGAHGAA